MTQTFLETLARVRTFQVGKWIYTEVEELDPYRLASMGYVVKNVPQQVQCSVCHHKISLSDDDIQNDSNHNGLLQKLKKHKQNCIYFGQEPIIYNKQKLYLFMDQAYATIKGSLKVLQEAKTFPILNDQEILSLLSGEIFIMKAINEGYKMKTDKIKITFFLSLFGWMAQKANQKIELKCLFCGRTTDLNDYQTSEQDQQSTKKPSQNIKQFNPIEEHRYYCIWVHQKHRQNPVVGWQICLQYLYDKMIESKSLFSQKKPEQTKKIRIQLDKYLQNFQQKTVEQFGKIKNIFSECEQMKMQLNEQIPTTTENPFQKSQKRMKVFVQEIDTQFKENIKKIKID